MSQDSHFGLPFRGLNKVFVHVRICSHVTLRHIVFSFSLSLPILTIFVVFITSFLAILFETFGLLAPKEF